LSGRAPGDQEGDLAVRSDKPKATLRCAVYTRVSTEHGLEQEFNSLDNQREASEAYIKSQAHEGWKLIRTHYDDGGYSGGSIDRPALQKLLDDVRAHRIDVIVVYKVDRLTRSLADFAKLVELFDAHQVSFVSVTQAFNTTTSMGRLTINVLLSFAQFEREVTGERIRDKIAASKRKGIWMGGVVPLGYRVENRALHVVEEHAAFIRDLFQRYLEIGSVVRLKAILDQEDARLPFRTDGTGKTIGGGLISRGHLYKILSNPIYLGRLPHRGQVHDGLHDSIIDRETWDRVQLLLAEHAQRTVGNCQNSDALLAGKLFDDRGNRMSPSHAAKGGRHWRYYVSQAVLQGRKHEAGSIARAPALEIEARVTEAVSADSPASNRHGGHQLHQPKPSGRDASTNSPAARPSGYAATLRAAIERVVMSRTTIEIELAEGMTSDDQNRILIIPWTPPSPRRREIIQGEGERPPPRAR
jgi:site-specific DNA recombinase